MKRASDAVTALVRDAEAKFGDQQARLEQLRAHAATVAMCLDLLQDSTEQEQGNG